MSAPREDRSSLPTGDHEELSVLCEKALDFLEAGLTMIRTHFESASLEEQEGIIEETEQMLMMTVAIESLLAAASEDGNRDGVMSACVSEFQMLPTRMTNSYEQEAIRERVVLDVVAVFHPAKPTGRPAIDIPGEQLRFLVENGFKITDMTQYSCRTISRRLKEFSIEYNVYTNINDSQLDEIVSDIAARLPCCGIKFYTRHCTTLSRWLSSGGIFTV